MTDLVVRALGEEWRLDASKDTYTIGRSPSADITLANGLVSSRHATVSRAPGGWVLTDEGSTNGTFVNGQRVSTLTLAPGAVVTFGGTGDGDDSGVRAEIVATTAQPAPVVSAPPAAPQGGWPPPPPPGQGLPQAGVAGEKKLPLGLLLGVGGGALAAVVALLLVLTLVVFNHDDATTNAAKEAPHASTAPSMPPAKPGDPVQMDKVYKITERAPLADTVTVSFDQTGGWKYVKPLDLGKEIRASGAGARSQYEYSHGIGKGNCSMTITPGVIGAEEEPDPQSDKPASEQEQNWWLGFTKFDAVKHKVAVKEVRPVVLPLGKGGVEMDTHEMSFTLSDYGASSSRNLVRAFGSNGYVLQLDFECGGPTINEAQFKQAMARIHLKVAKPATTYPLDSVVPGIVDWPTMTLGFTYDIGSTNKPHWLPDKDTPGAWISEDLCWAEPWFGTPAPAATKTSKTSDKPGTEAEMRFLADYFKSSKNLEETGFKSVTDIKRDEAVKIRLDGQAGQTITFPSLEEVATSARDGKKSYFYYVRRYLNAPRHTTVGAYLQCPSKALLEKYKPWLVRAASVSTAKHAK